ncbi:MAG TPA: hypothetical protein DIT75_02265, partial [Rikenellaceae bacterium]|nr:hypothetical protein [Rikenellaceae bacterium]
MKKTINILFAAALAIVSAACAREEIFENEQTRGEARTFTCAIDEDAQTRTEITKQGKTVWKEGDKILVSNGTDSDTLEVDSKFAGQKYFEFTTTLQGKIYVVYPYNSVKEIKDGKFTLEIPEVQNGEFGSANIACAIAEDRYVKMKNVTAVLRFRIPKEVTTPVTSVVINSVDNNVAGQFNVDLTSGAPVIETPAENAYTASVTVKTDGNNGNNFYATVIPGTYKAGFTMSAVTLDINKAIENKTTVSDKELKVNAYYDLGNIGTNLQPLGGDGSAAKPYLINNYAEFLMFTNYVNSGKTMRGQSVKLMNDIKGVKTSIGSVKFNSKGVVLGVDGKGGVGNEISVGNIPFQGEFDGNGKTVTVNLNNTSAASSGLFANVSDSAYIHDLAVTGTVTSNYKHAAGLAGFVRTRTKDNSKVSIRFVNCKNTATVTGKNYVGGLISWVDNTNKTANTIVFDNCSNAGTVTGDNLYVGGVVGYLSYANISKCSNSGSVTSTVFVGGLAGHSYMGTISDCTNSGDITATYTAGNFYYYKIVNKKYKWYVDNRGGAAGIAAFAQNMTIKRCSNSGKVEGVNKIGGIAGASFWTSVYSCKNSGAVNATEQAAGGIVGWAYVQSLIYDCLNTGDIFNKKYQAAGIVGQAQNLGSAAVRIKKCVNEGNCKVEGNGAAGILGYAQPYNNGGNTGATLFVEDCINKGEISGPEYSGGIIGAANPMYPSGTWAKFFVLNCENHAKVSGTKTGSKANVFVGGILGGSMGTNWVKQGINISNCLNTGDVLYADATALYPNAGGIAGRLFQGNPGGTGIFNCYNSGKVGPVSGAAVKGALYGGVIGYAQNGGGSGPVIGNDYYLDSSCDQMTGKDSKYSDYGCISAADVNGVFSKVLTYKDVNYDKVVDILNAWRNGNLSYYSWTAGPKFVYPSYADYGSGDYDLGNGG